MSAESESQTRAPRRVRAAIERLIGLSELLVVAAAELLLVGAILLATAALYGLFVGALPHSIGTIDSLDELQAAVEHVFAGVMLLLLGLELLKSLSSFFVGYRVQVEIIIVVAIIAVTRHILLIDFERTEASKLFAIAALVVALAVSYAIVRRGRGASEPDDGADAEA
jgi:uncharacterized membrane protein (DUF373 family)